MSLTEEVTFDKDGYIEKWPWLRPYFLSLVIILVALISFGLGRFSVVNSGGVKLEYDPQFSTDNQIPTTAQALQGVKNSSTNVIKSGEVVASSKGTKYHYPHCSGAKRISATNLIKFSSAEAAEASGYTLALNCQPK